ncbi:two-component sensor histidine kinase [Amylibacter ulvae]|uniref:histidine kinase n=1 Tax=Paramylibacter ulvae TaxID=1651968 RepID=A0ABQ3D6K8_9RHOB|nr:ATP-binding protein [Amylibacter ulvae]GHA58112.1 two-component sensor histidine kinase [Amylibacter ulvae]
MVQKWRPTLRTLIALVILTLMALPAIGLLTARLTTNQFVRETESSLVSQAAVFARTYAAEFGENRPNELMGNVLSPRLSKYYAQQFHSKIKPVNTQYSAILPERPDPIQGNVDLETPYDVIGEKLSTIAREAQKTSLAGYIALDYLGNVIASSGTIQGRFVSVAEVTNALQGEVSTVLRFRSGQDERHPLASLSRDTGFRVFVAMPVIVDERVIGAVYLARTPNNLGKFLFRERHTLMLVFGSVLLAASVVGFVMWRLLAGPIKELQYQSQRVAKGQSVMLEPLAHYGTKEVADMGQSLLSMSAKLNQRSAALQTYTAHVTHELKSPLTSISGAVELLQDSGARMDKLTQQKFITNIADDSDRMARLLDGLRMFAATTMTNDAQETELRHAVERFNSTNGNATYIGNPTATLPISDNDAHILVTQMGQNAFQHGATKVTFECDNNRLIVSDDGDGISRRNAEQIFEPFFTTNRDLGGTGMGLAIVRGIVTANGGEIKLIQAQQGATFEILFETQN